MSRKKTDINPKRAENIKWLIEEEKSINPKFSQTELAGRIHMTQQNISRIINQKTALTEETARDIVREFPKYRIEWLLGYDDYPTVEDLIRKGQTDTRLLHAGIIAFSELNGYQVEFASLDGSVETALQNLEHYCTISRGGKSKSFSLAELNNFENELCQIFDIRLQYMLR